MRLRAAIQLAPKLNLAPAVGLPSVGLLFSGVGRELANAAEMTRSLAPQVPMTFGNGRTKMIIVVKMEIDIEVKDSLQPDQIDEIARSAIAGAGNAVRHRRNDQTFSWRKRAGKLKPFRAVKLTLADLETRAWLRGNPRLKAGPITPEIQRHALKRAKGRCPECRTPWEKVKLPKYRKTAWDFHHRKRVFHWGKTTKDNIQALCIDCHKAVHRALAKHGGQLGL
jgi:5-methylcytosine-specific restriction endonuclease McrA